MRCLLLRLARATALIMHHAVALSLPPQDISVAIKTGRHKIKHHSNVGNTERRKAHKMKQRSLAAHQYMSP